MLNEQVVQRKDSEYQARLEQERAEALLDSYTTQRRLTHEFTNHTEALSLMLQQGDVEGAKAYLADVGRTIQANTAILNSHNPLLDALLSKKYEEAARRGVMMYFDLSDLRDIPLENTELVIVISNLLNNAIDAAAKALRPRCTSASAERPRSFCFRCATGWRKTSPSPTASCPAPPSASRATAWVLPTCRKCWPATERSLLSAAGRTGSALPARCQTASYDTLTCGI